MLRDFRLALATAAGVWVIFFVLGDTPLQALRRVIHGSPYAD